MLHCSRVVRDREWVFIANTSGVRYEDGFLCETIEGQAEQMIANVTGAIESVNGKVEDIIQVTIYIPDRDEMLKVKDILAGFLQDIRPAATFSCSPLATARLKIEMEATERLPTGAS